MTFRSQVEGSSCYWAFFANPRRYRIDDAVRDLAVDTWTTKGKPIRAGDRIIVWRGADRGGQRGIVALGVVLTDPQIVSDADNPYWIQTPSSEERVRVEYYTSRKLPLWLGEGSDHLLAVLTVSRARGGTVFHVTEAQWDAIVAAVAPESSAWPVLSHTGNS